jgi:thioredoxin-dependent peroxiredoxin
MTLHATEIPNFSATLDTGEKITQQFFENKSYVLFFYPRDDTPGCTIETKDFSSNKKQFSDLGIELFGVSKDDQSSHEKFKKKHRLSVDLLYDHEGLMCEAFQVWKEKTMYGKTYQGIERSTFLISKDGKILKTWRKVKVEGHVQEVIKTAQAL